MLKKISILIAALFAFLPAVPATAAPEDLPTYNNNANSSYDGYNFELWSQKRDEAVYMTLTGGGTFECGWNAQNILFRTGKKLGSAKNYEEYGGITVDYAAEFTILRGDVAYLCVYGWTEDPMIEFYIIESHGSYKPPGGKGFTGTIEVDGGTYELYVDTRVEQPSIQGTKTFEQYFAVRTDKRTEGTITVSDHFKAWEGLGLDMSGKLYEVAFCVEGYQSSGEARVYEHVLTIGGVEASELPDIRPVPSPLPSPSPSPSAASSPDPVPGDIPSDGPSGSPWLLFGGLGVVAAGGVIVILKNRKR